MTMPFGKHRGKELRDIPESYLLWLYREADLDTDLEHALLEELERRGWGEVILPAPRACPYPSVARELVASGLRVLAVKHHPDKGGDLELMKQVNATADWLRDVVGGSR